MKQMVHENLAGTAVSTVKLIGMSYKNAYETCAFWANGSSDVQETYRTELDAIAGHKKYCKKYGATIKKL